MGRINHPAFISRFSVPWQRYSRVHYRSRDTVTRGSEKFFLFRLHARYKRRRSVIRNTRTKKSREILSSFRGNNRRLGNLTVPRQGEISLCDLITKKNNG